MKSVTKRLRDVLGDFLTQWPPSTSFHSSLSHWDFIKGLLYVSVHVIYTIQKAAAICIINTFVFYLEVGLEKKNQKNRN